MTTAPSPVREPAWPLSRSAIGLWVTESVISSVVLGIGITAFLVFVPADAVYTQTGWLSRTWTLVPISRIQTVDVTRGVFQQLFGLSTVAVLTASSQGTVRVPHLETDVAHRVADDLAHRAEQVRDQAT